MRVLGGCVQRKKPKQRLVVPRFVCSFVAFVESLHTLPRFYIGIVGFICFFERDSVRFVDRLL